MYKKAAMYIRVSTEEQVEYSPESQRKAIRRFAEERAYEICECYEDIGISGREVKNRPAFSQMIAEAKGKPKRFEAILVWKFSRFSRSRLDSVMYKAMLRKAGVTVISVTEPLLDEPTAVLMEAMLEAMDEYYSLNLGEEVRRGMQEKFIRGGLVTIAPYGYCVQGGRLEIVEREAKWVREMFQWREEGANYKEIAVRLDMLGVKTKRGGKFHAREVSYLLRNPVYFGYQRWNGLVVKGNFVGIMEKRD